MTLLRIYGFIVMKIIYFLDLSFIKAIVALLHHFVKLPFCFPSVQSQVTFVK